LNPRFSPAAAREKAIAFLFLFLFVAGLHAQRVVSLAPGVTEIVFALGRGDKLVGVTKFCDYPEAAKKISKIGGFLDINIEALVSLAPDLVITYPEHAAKLNFLRRQARVISVAHGRLSELLRSIREIGRALDAEEQAGRLVAGIRSRLRQVSLRTAGRKRVRALCIAGRSPNDLRNMIAIGRKDFLNDLLEIAGGTNAYPGRIDYPNISLESVIRMRPELIIEISSRFEGIPDERIFAFWKPLVMVPAVAERRVRIVRDSFWLRPGPRVGQIAEELARLLHASVDLP